MSKSLLSIALFLCVNGVLSSKHKHHNKHNKEIEQEDYSSPLADDEQFVDKSFLPKAFFPTSGNKDGSFGPTLEGHAVGPTLDKAGDDAALPTFEGQALPTPDALDDDAALPTFEALDDPALPTVEGGILPTPDGTALSKNMNVNIHSNNNTSNGNFMIKLLLFSVFSAVIVGLYLFYKKRNNNSKYISISQDNEHEELGDIESQKVTKYVEDIGERTALL